MIEVKPGSVFTASVHKKGVSQGGEWEFVSIKEEKGRKTMTVWASNIPSGVEEGQPFIVEKIDRVKYGSRKVADKWFDEVTITAVIKPAVGVPSAPSTFTPINDNEELPF